MSRKCPGCKCLKGDTVGESAIYKSHDIPTLCEDCWHYEDNLIEEEGTNNPEYSMRISETIGLYRLNMQSREFY